MLHGDYSPEHLKAHRHTPAPCPLKEAVNFMIVLHELEELVKACEDTDVTVPQSTYDTIAQARGR